MTVPLPAQGDTSWYDWATYIDGAISSGLNTEAVQDAVAGMVTAGANITKTYDDTAGTLTIAATNVMVVVNHGATASTARPAGAAAVYWIGTVTPTNMTAADLYNGPA